MQHGTGDDRGDVYVRLAHFGGMVFTHYDHLAAVPRRILRGAPVKAGDLIGLVGDTGSEHPGRYIHFALSIHPSSEFPEAYWDPTALMAALAAAAAAARHGRRLRPVGERPHDPCVPSPRAMIGWLPALDRQSGC